MSRLPARPGGWPPMRTRPGVMPRSRVSASDDRSRRRTSTRQHMPLTLASPSEAALIEADVRHPGRDARPRCLAGCPTVDLVRHPRCGDRPRPDGVPDRPPGSGSRDRIRDGVRHQRRRRVRPMTMAEAVAISAVVLVLAIVGFILLTSYNAIVALRQRIDKAWSNIDVILKQRHDELPNLVTAVRDLMAYERDVLVRVTEARAPIHRPRRSRSGRDLRGDERGGTVIVRRRRALPGSVITHERRGPAVGDRASRRECSQIGVSSTTTKCTGTTRRSPSFQAASSPRSSAGNPGPFFAVEAAETVGRTWTAAPMSEAEIDPPSMTCGSSVTARRNGPGLAARTSHSDIPLTPAGLDQAGGWRTGSDLTAFESCADEPVGARQADRDSRRFPRREP